jgi:hypothetical protein
MKVLLDTDLASAFAKVGRLELLVRLFAGIDLGIAFEVYKELLVPLEHDYHFPEGERNRPYPQRPPPYAHERVFPCAYGRRAGTVWNDHSAVDFLAGQAV